MLVSIVEAFIGKIPLCFIDWKNMAMTKLKDLSVYI